MRWSGLAARLAGLLLVAACAAADPPPPADPGPASETVHVISNGWHTAIVVAATDIARSAPFPEAGDYPGAAFLEFGWGDRDYYPAREKTLGMTLAAAMVPTPAVLHIAARDGLPDGAGREEEALSVALSEVGLRRLVVLLAETVERGGEARAPKLAEGLAPASGFYPATGEFHLFNTCNTWTVRTLRAAGLDVSASGVVTAADAMDRLRAARGVHAAPAEGHLAALKRIAARAVLDGIVP